MTEKQLKEYEKEVAAMQDERLNEFQQRVEMSELNNESKKELFKYIEARREALNGHFSLFAENGEIKDGEFA